MSTGKIELLETVEGITFQIRLPIAEACDSLSSINARLIPDLWPPSSRAEPEQLSAVEHFEAQSSACGAGSGKTRVLTARACNLIHTHGVPADYIMAVTLRTKLPVK